MNIMTYARHCEMQWEQMMLDMSGYKRITTFYADLSIAEAFGIKQVRSTYNDVFNAWGKNVKYITEFVLCLNHKI